jgi:hypothetical protein
MAAENDKGKGKETEKASEAEVEQGGPWFGRFQDGKWFCDCNKRARCLTVSKEGSKNLGKKCKFLLILLCCL